MHGHDQEPTSRPDDDYFSSLEAEMFPGPTDGTREALADAVAELPEPTLVITDGLTRVIVPDGDGNKVIATAQVRTVQNRERDTLDYTPRIDFEVWDEGRPFSAHTVRVELGEEVNADPRWQVEDRVERIAVGDDPSAKWVRSAWALLNKPQDPLFGPEVEGLVDDCPPEQTNQKQRTRTGSYDFPNGTSVTARFSTGGEESPSGWVKPAESSSYMLLVVTMDGTMYHLLKDEKGEQLNVATLQRQPDGGFDQEQKRQRMLETANANGPTEESMSSMAAALNDAVNSELVR